MKRLGAKELILFSWVAFATFQSAGFADDGVLGSTWSIDGKPVGSERPNSSQPKLPSDNFRSDSPGAAAAHTMSSDFVRPLPATTPGATVAEPVRQAASSSGGTLMLTGRIEELVTGKGARIPLKLKAMVPIRDTSLDNKPAMKVAAKQTQLNSGIAKTDPASSLLKAGAASQQIVAKATSFPSNWRGTWSGDMTITMVDFDPRSYEFDPAETEKQKKMATPGTQGRCSVTFYEGSNNSTEVKPTQVVFSKSMTEAVQSMSDSPMGALLGALGGGADNPMLANMQVPAFALPLGDLGGANSGVTGNQMSSELMKNKLTQLSNDVLEQQIVTRDTERSATKVRDSFTESVLRFTRKGNDRLYCQAASVSYDANGNYLNKILLRGYLDRGAAPAPSLGSFGGQGVIPEGGGSGGALGGPGGGFGGLGGGGGLGGLGGLDGLGGGGGEGGSTPENLQNKLEQLQKMYKQLGNE